MRHRAVVFDLFGTLVDNHSFVGHPSAEWLRTLAAMAEVVGAPAEAFTAQWAATSRERTTGAFPTVEACIGALCARIGLASSAAAVAAAAALRIGFMRRNLVPRPDAVGTLRQLKDEGYRVGLISNCIPDVPLLWEDTPFAPWIHAPVLSCVVGLAKPDPRIYQLACVRLEVDPGEALFVADGEGGELAGAAAVGLQPVLIRASYQDPPGHRRPHVEPWDGPAISWLDEVQTLLR